jgi:transcriptional regulator with XRE-family HTH domain
MFFEQFQKLCQKKGVRAADVSRDLSISKSTISSWKKHSNVPNSRALNNIATYFNVSVPFLLWGDSSTPDFLTPDGSMVIEVMSVGFNQLNAAGQQKVLEYMQDLGPQYKKEREDGNAEEEQQET